MDELLNKLDQAGVRYLLVCGQAIRLMGMPRFSIMRQLGSHLDI